MRIDGKEIAQKILQNLSFKVIPHLVIILIGDNPAWKAYVRQKELKAKEIGAKTTTLNLALNASTEELLKTIEQLNNDSNVHGIIVQRPLPTHLEQEKISLAITPQKDIDGFHPNSKFEMPLAVAVLKILEEIFQLQRLHLREGVTLTQGVTLTTWLKTKKIVIIGKGETGGGPIIQKLRKLGIKPEIIDSKTPNPQLLTKTADIIISCVGKPNVIQPENIKKDLPAGRQGVILISVGLYREEDGKLHGDYDEEEIKDIAAFYTPTPGGVGPVNIACLLENLVKATEKTS